jgi:predicted Zn-dependent peptidase
MQKNIFRHFVLALAVSATAFQIAASGQGAAPDITTQAGLVTEFDVNGMKVLVKRRPGSATIAAGLFFRGGTKNLTAQNAGIESFTLNVATEGSVAFPESRFAGSSPAPAVIFLLAQTMTTACLP